MRFHVIALPHTQVTKDFFTCAYTEKTYEFCNMMTSLGHEVFFIKTTAHTPEIQRSCRQCAIHFLRTHRGYFIFSGVYIYNRFPTCIHG